jgi:hypothetical protein
MLWLTLCSSVQPLGEAMRDSGCEVAWNKQKKIDALLSDLTFTHSHATSSSVASMRNSDYGEHGIGAWNQQASKEASKQK